MKFDQVIAKRENKTVYRDGDRCIKVFDENFSKADILNEALNQARVEESGLHIPKISEVTTIDGKWAIISQYIAGKTLAQLMEEHPERMDEYLELFVDLQIQVQSKTDFRLNKHKDKMKKKIILANLDPNTRYDLLIFLNSTPDHNKLCHGDFNPSNIIIFEDGTPYVLDWSHATQGNASGDVARTYLLFMMDEQKEIAEKYLELFCRKTNTEKQYVRRWIPVLAASRLVKGFENERDFLMTWVAGAANEEF